MRCTFK